VSGREAAVDRRAALKTLAGAAGLGAAGHLVSACRSQGPASSAQPPTSKRPAAVPETSSPAAARPGLPVGNPVRVPVRDLPSGGRKVVDYGDAKVEVRRTDAGVEARLLLCTHFGCPVTWDEARERYTCPCHGGLFSAEGEPVAGPPTTALLRVPVAVSTDEVTVGASAPGSS